MNHDQFEYDHNNDPWYAPIVLIVGLALAFAGLVWAFNYAKAEEIDPYIIRLTATKENQLAVVFQYAPQGTLKEFATKQECEALLFTKDFFNDVVAPGMYAMVAQYGDDIDPQIPECVLASVNTKQIEEMKARARQQKGEEL